MSLLSELIKEYRQEKIKELKDKGIKDKEAIYEATWFGPARFCMDKLFEKNDFLKMNFDYNITLDSLNKLLKIILNKGVIMSPHAVVFMNFYMVSENSMATIEYEIIGGTYHLRQSIIPVLRKIGLQKKTGRKKIKWNLDQKSIYDEYESIHSVRAKWQKML